MPDHPHKPPSTSRTVGYVAATTATAAILIVSLILRPPPAPYRGILMTLAVIAVVIGVGIVLGALVLTVEARFAKRYDRAEAAADAHRKTIEDRLQALDDRAHRICRQQHQAASQNDRCMKEVGVVAEGLDELRELYVDQDAPRRPI